MELEFLKQNMLLLALIASSGLMLMWPLLRRSGAKSVSASEATLLINREDALIVDVRSVAEFSAGHIPGAINIPAEKLTDRVDDLSKHKARPIIVACQSGVRTSGACSKLKKVGFERLYELSGGLGAWQQAGLPLKKGNK